MEYLFLFSLQLVNNLWNEKELIIQKVFIVEKCILVAPIIAENGGYKTASWYEILLMNATALVVDPT